MKEIEKFMQGRFCPRLDGQKLTVITDDLKDYENDLNHLMSVVEKIEKISDQKYGRFKVTIKDNSCLIQSEYIGKESRYSRSVTSPTKKEAILRSCLEFIEFYNTKL